MTEEQPSDFQEAPGDCLRHRSKAFEMGTSGVPGKPLGFPFKGNTESFKGYIKLLGYPLPSQSKGPPAGPFFGITLYFWLTCPEPTLGQRLCGRPCVLRQAAAQARVRVQRVARVVLRLLVDDFGPEPHSRRP